MSNRKPKATPAIELEPSLEPSLEVPVVLHYSGGPIYGDVPARDLSAADLAYIHRVGALRTSGGEPVKPATEAELGALADRLEATGSFSRNDPTTAAPGAPADPAEENVG